MVGAGRRPVKAAWLVLLLATACFWRSYGALAATHADLLADMARKGADLVEHGRFSAESMPELTYPLERAQAFARAAAARADGARPASLDAFDTLVARYRDFVDALDRARREHAAGAAAAGALAAPLDAVVAARARVRDALAAEGRL